MPARIEIFTAQDRPIHPPQSDNAASLPLIEVYEVDGIASFETAMSEGFPSNRETAQRVVQERLGQSDASRLDTARQSAVGLLNAAEYGIDRYPAIVFDGDSIVYGVTDMAQALRLYRKWKGGALQ